MSPTLKRPCGHTILAIAFVAALSGGPAAAQTTTPESPAENMTACDFEAESRDPGEQGLVAVRDAPSASANALSDSMPPAFRVRGAKDGWLLIEGWDPLALRKGWVDGRSVTTKLYRETLKAAPDNAAPDIVSLNGYGDDGADAYGPPDVTVRRILDCSGQWLEVEISRPGLKSLSGDPASPDGRVVGWTDRSCPDQADNEDCKLRQFNYPWSPLPAGTVECNFGAFSGDPDPAGLNVRAEPDANARILGRLPPPIKFGPADRFFSGALVIGYRKGWFLIERGYTEDLGGKSQPKFAPYRGRGWVAANLLTMQPARPPLKRAPSEDSGNVALLANPQDTLARRILACSGDWVQVEIKLSPNDKPLMKTDAPLGAVRGWADGACASQKTTCDLGGAPLPPPAPSPPE